VLLCHYLLVVLRYLAAGLHLYHRKRRLRPERVLCAGRDDHGVAGFHFPFPAVKDYASFAFRNHPGLIAERMAVVRELAAGLYGERSGKDAGGHVDYPVRPPVLVGVHGAAAYLLHIRLHGAGALLIGNEDAVAAGGYNHIFAAHHKHGDVPSVTI